MEQELKYLKDKISKLSSSLTELNRMAAQSPDYAYSQKKVAEELKLLRSILTFIEER